MALATEKTAETFFDIIASTPLNCDWPLFADDEVEVIYGQASLVAVAVDDYVVEISEPDFDEFTVTPTAALLTKINDLIDDDETATEINFVTVRRKLDYLTSVQPETVRQTAFLSREIDRIHMRLIQLNEVDLRTLKFAPKAVGDEDEQVFIDTLVADSFLVVGPDGTTIINGPTVADFETVSDNIDDIITVAEAIANINICATNIANINEVATEIGGVGNLAALAALNNTAGLLVQTGNHTFARRSVVGNSDGIVVTNGQGTSGDIGLTLSSNLSLVGKNITGGTWTGMTDIAVADGGTGASSASGARTNLGLSMFVNGSIQDGGAGFIEIISGGFVGIGPRSFIDTSGAGIGFTVTNAGPFSIFMNGGSFDLSVLNGDASLAARGFVIDAGSGGFYMESDDDISFYPSNDFNVYADDIVLNTNNNIWFGVRTANADAAITGYITIKDSGGTLRKLALIN